MLRSELAGELRLDAILLRDGVVWVRGVLERELRVAILIAACREEPEAIRDDLAAEGRLVGLREFVDQGFLQGARLRPARVGQTVAQRACEGVAARLRDGIDHAAGESPVFGRDGAGLDRR